MNPPERGEFPALPFRLIKFQGRRSIAVPVSRRPRSALVLAPLRSSADGVFSSCVNRFYAECNREMREGNSAPHCLFQKPLVSDDTLSFYPISGEIVFIFRRKFQDVTKTCLSIIEIVSSTEMQD